MPAWTDIRTLDDSQPEDAAGFDEARQRIEKIIQAEMKTGVTSERIVLGGFSQGGAVAYNVGTRSTVQLGSLIACSCWLPMRGEALKNFTATAKTIPIMHNHGTSNQLQAFTNQ